jgi:drug/metabolite transporter (DMT)-like permease
MRRSILVSVIIGVGLCVGSFLLWWLPDAYPDRYSDLGTALLGALVGGGVVASVVLFLERRHASEAEKRNLQLMLGVGNSFVGIDLRGRDLSGF